MTSIIEPALLRASVLGGRGQLDLALPADVPIAALVPELTALLAPGDAAAEPGTWTLSPLGGPSYPPAQTLADAGARDGDLLLLARELPAQAAPVFDDVAEGVAVLSHDGRRAWSASAAGLIGRALATVAAGATTCCVLVARTGDDRAAAAIFSALLAVAAIAGAGAAARRRLPGAPLAATSAYVLAAGAGALAPPPGAVAVTVVTAAAAAASSAILTHRLTGTGDSAHAAGITLALLLLFAGAIATLWQAPPQHLAALLSITGLAVVAAAPRLAIAAAALPLPPVPSESSGSRLPSPGADQEPHEHGDQRGDSPIDSIAQVELTGLPVLLRRTRLAGDLLTGIVVGGAAVTGAAVATTALAGPFDWRTGLFAAAVTLSLAARGRTHRDFTQAAALIGVAALTALTVITAMTVRGSWPPLTGAALAAGLGVAAVAAGSVLPRHEFSPVQRRAGEISDYALLVLIVPLALWIMGVYQLVRAH